MTSSATLLPAPRVNLFRWGSSLSTPDRSGRRRRARALRLPAAPAAELQGAAQLAERLWLDSAPYKIAVSVTC